MGRVSVRKGRRSDATQFLGLLEELARFEKLALPTPAAKKRIVRDIFDRKKIRLLLAVDGEECLGYAIYSS
ncbi:MAG: hypothetical protein HY297_03205 [Thaumarchaeota archaeon]|nr:hypothetical protein [Nitrososphaerota archaeon]